MNLLFLLTFAAISPNQKALEELRVQLFDAQKAASTHQIEIELLKEEIATLKKIKNSDLKTQLIEKTLEKLSKDVQELKTHANQTTNSLIEYKNQITKLERDIQTQNEKLKEVVKLKGTLSSISKAVGAGPKIYKVRSGDTLEKIAREYNTTIDALKKANGLSSNTIIVGQELRIP